MPVRRPLYLDGDNLREMTSTELEAVRTEAIRQFALEPTLTLSVLPDSGNLPTLSDTRLQAGASSSSFTSFPSEAFTAEPSVVTVNYLHTFLDSAPGSDSAEVGNGFPVYADSSGNIRSMDSNDFMDTFVKPALNRVVGTSLAESDAGGTYFISTNPTDPGGTNLGTVYVDTTADLSLYSAAGIPETLDQPTVVMTYYLYQVPAADPVDFPRPLFLRPDGDLQQYEEADFQTRIRQRVQPYFRQNITYTFDSGGGDGFNRGTGMVDNQLSGTTGNYQTRFVNVNDYRAQEFPFGTPVVQSTTFLKIQEVT